MVRIFNDRGVYRCRAELSTRARPGVVVALGVWWRKFGRDGVNVNELTSPRLTDIGRGPTFYDCLVEVEADRPGETAPAIAGAAAGSAIGQGGAGNPAATAWRAV